MDCNITCAGSGIEYNLHVCNMQVCVIVTYNIVLMSYFVCYCANSRCGR